MCGYLGLFIEKCLKTHVAGIKFRALYDLFHYVNIALLYRCNYQLAPAAMTLTKMLVVFMNGLNNLSLSITNAFEILFILLWDAPCLCAQGY